HVRAGHPHGDAELVALDDLAAAQQPDPVAALVPDPELAFVGRGLAAEVRLDRGEDASPVERMDDAVPLAAEGADIARRVAELLARDLVVLEAVAAQVPVPQAQI